MSLVTSIFTITFFYFLPVQDYVIGENKNDINYEFMQK